MNRTRYGLGVAAIAIVVLLAAGVLGVLDDQDTDIAIPSRAACAASEIVNDRHKLDRNSIRTQAESSNTGKNQQDKKIQDDTELKPSVIDEKIMTDTASDNPDNRVIRNALVHELTRWDNSIIPKTIPESESDEGPNSMGYTPIFVDIDSLVNIDKSQQIKERLWSGAGRPKYNVVYDGSLDIKVIAPAFIAKLQVVNIGSNEAWEHEWKYKTNRVKNMFVPFEFGDMLLVRTHQVDSEYVIEHYYSSMSLAVRANIGIFDRTLLIGRNPSSEGGSFQVESSNGTPVADAVLLDSSQQVLGRTDSQGVLHWNKLIGNKLLGEDKSMIRYPVVLWKSGHVPVVFDKSHPTNKTVPTSGIVKIGVPSVFVSAYLPGVAQLVAHEKHGTTDGKGITRSYCDLLPIPDNIEITDSNQIRPFLGLIVTKPLFHDVLALEFPDWDGHFAEDENGKMLGYIDLELDVPGFPDGSFKMLANWYFQHWVIDSSGILTVELPVAGKYLLRIGSFQDVPYTGIEAGSPEYDARYGEASHFVFIDARDPKKPILKLFARPR